MKYLSDDQNTEKNRESRREETSFVMTSLLIPGKNDSGYPKIHIPRHLLGSVVNAQVPILIVRAVKFSSPKPVVADRQAKESGVADGTDKTARLERKVSALESERNQSRELIAQLQEQIQHLGSQLQVALDSLTFLSFPLLTIKTLRKNNWFDCQQRSAFPSLKTSEMKH